MKLLVFQQAKGAAKPSFTSHFIEKGYSNAEEESILKWSSAAMYAGGAGTVSRYHGLADLPLQSLLTLNKFCLDCIDNRDVFSRHGVAPSGDETRAGGA